MLTPEQWNEVLDDARDVKKARAAIALNARAHLMTIAPGLTITTNQLIDTLYPREIAERTLRGDRARKNLAVLIVKLATAELADCCVKGDVEGKYMGHPKRPWIWFAPARGLCPHCGQIMPESEEE